MKYPKPGKYQHYKNKYYQVFGIARDGDDPDNRDKLNVVYRPLYKIPGFNSKEFVIRPLKLFTEKVIDASGKKVPRFKYIGPM